MVKSYLNLMSIKKSWENFEKHIDWIWRNTQSQRITERDKIKHLWEHFWNSASVRYPAALSIEHCLAGVSTIMGQNKQICSTCNAHWKNLLQNLPAFVGFFSPAGFSICGVCFPFCQFWITGSNTDSQIFFLSDSDCWRQKSDLVERGPLL